MYLEGIFIGGDIRSQLPEEAKKFDQIDKTFRRVSLCTFFPTPRINDSYQYRQQLYGVQFIRRAAAGNLEETWYSADEIQIQIRTCRARLTNCPGALTKCQKAMRNR